MVQITNNPVDRLIQVLHQDYQFAERRIASIRYSILYSSKSYSLSFKKNIEKYDLEINQFNPKQKLCTYSELALALVDAFTYLITFREPDTKEYSKVKSILLEKAGLTTTHKA